MESQMTDRVGQQLGNYRLTRLIGRGGFAEVYLGEHIYLKTLAAIKVLQMELGDEDRGSFLDEARTIAHLNHPHIVRVLDFGIENATPYLVMDYAPNGSLRDYFSKGVPIPAETIMPYVKQIASALQYAHKQNLIHRDVKPGNFLLGRENQVLLSDFGIALVAQSSLSQTTEDTVTGTVAYMAPEQIRGKPRPASDQYALAVAVYEWLSGERPFQGSFPELVTQQMMTQPLSLRERVPTIAPDIDEVVMVALSKDPKERFATVEAFAHALEQASETSARGPAPAQTRSLPPPQAPRPRPPLPAPTIPATPSTSLRGQAMAGQAAPGVYPQGVYPQRQEPAPLQVPQGSGQILMPPQMVSRQMPPLPQSSARQIPRGNRLLKQTSATLGGAVLYGGLILLAQYTFARNANVTIVGSVSLAFIISCLANAVLPFSGVAFGSLTGAFTGLLGMFIADFGGAYIQGAPQYVGHNPLWYIGAAIVGFLAGILVRGTPGHRKSTLTTLIVDVIGAAGASIGFLRLLGENDLLSAAILTVVFLHAMILTYNARVDRGKPRG